ncbi:MAG: agmatine/peptidylarginine deiminase [Verrucomicrobiales bacterium]|jgi:agmatine/peptidylarginine deiminase
MNRFVISSLSLLISGGQSFAAESAVAPGNSLIVFHAPSINENYYAPKFDELLQFYRDFVNVAHRRDFPLIVTDAATRPSLEALIDSENLITGSARDIWVRDFGPISTTRGVFKARYRPNYLPAEDAAWIEEGFNRFFPALKIPVQKLNLIIDGGNFVGNGGSKAVITSRVLEDNPSLTEAQIRTIFRDQLGVTELAIIPPEAADTTGHADGMVHWLATDILAVNRYFGGFRTQVRNSLTQQLPGVTLVEVPWNPTNRVWRDFADSTGVYVNAMNTPNAIYVPQYGLNTDAAALAAFRDHADRPVIGVPVSPDIAIMGGAARCLCWQVSGPAAANAPIPEIPLPDYSAAVQDLSVRIDSSSQVEVSWRIEGVPDGPETIFLACRIQRSSDLFSWINVGNEIPASGASANHQVSLSGADAVGFYRIALNAE